MTRFIVDDPLLLVRTENGEIRAFLNSCSHRGTYLCAADSGNQKAFACPYHGWTYNLNGELIGVALGNAVYGTEMNRTEWGLCSITQLVVYRGMIFGNLDASAMTLEDYLGEMRLCLDLFLARSDDGLEVRGAPQRWLIEANWKLTYENFTADPYHAQTAQRSTVETGKWCSPTAMAST